MISGSGKIRILVFIGSMRSGGKERRLIELLSFLKSKKDLEFMVVLTHNEIHYPDFYKLGIPYHVIRKRWKKNDITIFYQFYKLCKQYKPHLIHSWGRMQSFYALPAVIVEHIPLVNSQITSAPPHLKKWSLYNLIDRINFKFSKVILSNSQAGIEAYHPPAHKWRVIYNGINMNRFRDLPCVELVKTKYNIQTPYVVIMSASFSPHKDYDLFLRVAKRATQLREDVTFIGIGGYDDSPVYKKLLSQSADNPRILFPGRIDDVEALVNASTIGVLFSNKAVHGEGISNAVMEYMSLAKPVIANDAGGTKEIVRHNQNGYLIVNESEEEIIAMLLELINDQEKRSSFGAVSRRLIHESFSLDKMGSAFEQVYREALA